MKLATIKSRATFQALRQSGKTVRQRPFRVVYMEMSSEPQVGFALPKTLGSAVKRNRLKRRMIEAIKLVHAERPLKGAYLFRMGKTYASQATEMDGAEINTTEMSFGEITLALRELLGKINR